MSTKTSIKRIALVAVSALGFGLLSVVPSNAATTADSNAAISLTNNAGRITTTATDVTATLVQTAGTRIDDVFAYRLQTPTQTYFESAIRTCTDETDNAGECTDDTPTAQTNPVNGSSASIAITYANNNADEVATGVLTVPAALLTVVGTYTVTAFIANGTEGDTQNDITTAIGAGANVYTATFDVAAPSFVSSTATAANIDSATTVNTPGFKADGTATGAELLSQGNTALATSAPGVSFTANAAIADSVATITVPASSAIAFALKASAATTTADRTYLRVNGAQVGITTMAAAATTTINWTAPATTGTYTLVFDTYISGDGTEASAGNSLRSFNNTVTVTVAAAATGLTDFGNAADTTASTGTNLVGHIIPAVGATIVEPSGRVGQFVGFAPNYFIKRNAGSALISGDLSGLAANLNYSVAGPTGAAVSVVNAKVAGVASTQQTFAPAAATTLTNSSATATSTTLTSTKGSTVYFSPASAGTYTITVWHDANRDDLVSIGEASSTTSVVVAADALPSITFTKYGTSTTAAMAGAAEYGQLVKISLRNGSTPWTLGANEKLTLTGPTGTIFSYVSLCTAAGCTMGDTGSGAGDATDSDTQDLVAANFNGSGDAWVNVGINSTVGGTFSVNAVISGGTAAGASGSFAMTIIKTDGTATAFAATEATASTTAAKTAAQAPIVNANALAGVAGSSITVDDADATWTVKTGTASTVTASYEVGTSTYEVYSGLVTDTLGLITGVAGAQYYVAPTSPTTSTAGSKVSFSVAIPTSTALLPAGTTVAQLTLESGANDSVITIQNDTAIPTDVSVDPASLATTYVIRAATKSSNKFTATVFDQFGNAMTGISVTAQVTAGRNVQALPTPLITDANGSVSFTVTDAYTGTLISTDTLTFSAGVNPNVVTGDVTINYAAYNPVSTITITGGASADVAPTVTYSLITAGTAGPTAGAVIMTATLKDANGATLPAGIPVTWAISGLTGTSAIWTDPSTGYDYTTSLTDSNGQATTVIYAWAVGTVSVTATSGGVTSATAGKINFLNAAGDARVVSATVAGNVITAKVVDRYGNAVAGVSLTATRNSGTGYFSGAASSSAVGITNAKGVVDFVMAGGAANVTIATTTLNFGQTSSAAGQVNGTAITAGSVGESLSPAGVQSVTVDVTAADPGQTAAEAASDAALEAIDAANAATDAANLAAEAADAATVAAEEARDAADAATAAVEALASEMATLFASLKAQLTTLANTVAKIAKKVKA